MNAHNKHHPGPTTDFPLTDASEAHHGDLRKRAYLKRRAAYQMQSHSGSTAQAGAMRTKRPGHD